MNGYKILCIHKDARTGLPLGLTSTPPLRATDPPLTGPRPPPLFKRDPPPKAQKNFSLASLAGEPHISPCHINELFVSTCPQSWLSVLVPTRTYTLQPAADYLKASCLHQNSKLCGGCYFFKVAAVTPEGASRKFGDITAYFHQTNSPFHMFSRVPRNSPKPRTRKHRFFLRFSLN